MPPAVIVLMAKDGSLVSRRDNVRFSSFRVEPFFAANKRCLPSVDVITVTSLPWPDTNKDDSWKFSVTSGVVQFAKIIWCCKLVKDISHAGAFPNAGRAQIVRTMIAAAKEAAEEC